MLPISCDTYQVGLAIAEVKGRVEWGQDAGRDDVLVQEVQESHNTIIAST